MGTVSSLFAFEPRPHISTVTQIMAVNFAETWQSCAFQLPSYTKGDTYSPLLSLFMNSDSPNTLNLKGNQPTLSKNRLGDLDVEVLVTALSSHHSQVLEELSLGHNSISDQGIEFIAEYIKTANCSLRTLDLSYTDIGPGGAEKLASALQFNNSITTLLLDGCKIGRGGGIQIASMLQVNRCIATLGLSSCDLDTDCLIAMSTVLHGNQSIRQIDLSRPLLHSRMEETTVHISKMLKVNIGLREIHLSKHGMTDTGVEWICRMLKENRTLTVLDLSCNKLSRDGARHLSVLLRLNTPLTHLDISNNRIEDDGLVYISQALATTNTNLTNLRVCQNSISDKGICSLAETLKAANTTLSHAYIWGNHLGEPTCNAYRELLESERLLPDNTDVRSYEVDGVNYLARTD